MITLDDGSFAAKEGFLFGCDPELFVFDPDGNPVSAHSVDIPGTKENPFPVDGGAVQKDGFAAEFNIDPAPTFEAFNANIEKVLGSLNKMLPPGYTLRNLPSVHFSKEVFDAAPDDDKILGCTADFNAWTGGQNDIPDVSADPYMRCAGGHLHLGWTEDASLSDIQHLTHCRDLVKQLDWYLGAWSLQMDNDATRRKLYGKAGACRYKPYGVEYRVLSNFWVMDKTIRLAVWNRMQKAIADMRSHYMPDMSGEGFTNALITSINTSQRDPYLEKRWANPVVGLNAVNRRF